MTITWSARLSWRSDAALVEQVGPPVAHDLQDFSLVSGGLGGQVAAASSDRPQCSCGHAALEIPVVVDPELAGGGTIAWVVMPVNRSRR